MLVPKISHLESPGHLLLMTRFGALDLLGSLSGGEDYQSLLPHSESVMVENLRIRILTLEKLMAVKEATGAAKDQQSLRILRRTLDQRRADAD